MRWLITLISAGLVSTGASASGKKGRDFYPDHGYYGFSDFVPDYGYSDVYPDDYYGYGTVYGPDNYYCYGTVQCAKPSAPRPKAVKNTVPQAEVFDGWSDPSKK